LSDPQATLYAQLIGAGSIAVFMALGSALVWLAVKAIIGLRLSQAEEAIGIDKIETGALAYPEFSTKSLFDKA
jgi:Amt family ammonium transporter